MYYIYIAKKICVMEQMSGELRKEVRFGNWKVGVWFLHSHFDWSFLGERRVEKVITWNWELK